MLEFLKDYSRPSLPLPMTIALAIGVAWLWWRGSARAPRMYLTLIAVCYALAAMPVGVSVLGWPLAAGAQRIDSRQAAAGADTVVLLGGGVGSATVGGRTAGVPTASSLLRALEAARVFHAIGARLLVASGGTPRPERQAMSESAVLRRLVVDAGVPSTAVIEESRSTTTAGQAAFVRDLLRARGVERIVVVTSPMHMKRALGLFRAEHLDAIGSPAPLRSETSPAPPLLLPNVESLAFSDDAVYEYAALAYYWARGRLGGR